MEPKTITHTVLNHTIFCTDKEHTIRIDSTIKVKTTPNPNGTSPFVNYSTGFYIKVHNHAQKGGEDFKVYLTPETTLSLASHMLCQLDGTQGENYEALTGRGGTNILRAGITAKGPGLLITIGGNEAFAPLNNNMLRGFAELLKVTVANVEAGMLRMKMNAMFTRSR